MFIYYHTNGDIPEIKMSGKSLISKNGTLVTLEVQESENSYRYRTLMGKPQLVLRFSLPAFVEIPVGAWCEFMGQTFTLNDPENIKKNGTRNIEYTMTMGTDEDLMSLYKMRNSVDHRLKYSMCATPREFIQEIVANLNEHGGGGWSVGTCIESTAKTIEFNHSYIDDALQSVADTFETEWEIVNKAISLHKVEYFKDSPLSLSYGKGNGFIPGVGRSSISDEKPVKRLYVQGGDKNIDRTAYGSKELLLPKSQTLVYEGRTYKVDADGFYIERYDVVSDAVKEDSIDLSEIYPSRIGEVSEVVSVKPEKNFYDIVDSSIPNSLDYNNYLIEGETMTIIFQSGMLAGDGKEFEVKYYHDAKGTAGTSDYKKGRRFEIVPQEIDGQIMPNETFKPVAGDTYAIFGCSLPDEYICDNNSKTGASWDMFREAARYLYEHEEQKFTFTGTLQGLYAKRNWLEIGGRLKVGAYILFSDTQFAPEGKSIRITGIKEFITSPYTPTIEISNSVSGSTTSSKIKHIDDIEVEIDDTYRTIINFTKRRFRDALQTIEMLQDAQLNFSESINPITVQTMAALIGDESLQFRFVLSKATLTPVSYLITYDNAAKTLHCPHGFLQHMTLGINGISSSHAKSEYKVWEMSEYTSPVLTDGTKKYYLYAKVSTDTSVRGNFLLSETAIGIDSVSGYYHLLVGVLNSELEEERSYVDLYGFTEILPGRITTDRIVSSSGTSYFDMLNNAMKLGDALDFNSQGDGKLRIKGTIVQSESGDEQPLGVFRGWWNASYIYYKGDEVLYLTDNQIVTYRYINDTPSKGNLPTNTTYWSPIAKGLRGDFKSRVFKRQNTKPDTPSGGTYDSPIPSGWNDGIPNGEAIIWSSVCTFYGAGGSSGWSTPAPESDSDTLDIEFSPSETQPSVPSGDTPYADHSSEGWYDPSNLPSGQTMIWRAERKVSNGVYDGSWVITRIYGEKGDTGQSSFKSTMFVRMNSTPQTPTGGSYANPSPSAYAGRNSDDTIVYWGDGIPSGKNKLWASTRIFSSDGESPQQSAWTTPREMTDTSTYDVEFARKQTNDATPATPTTANRHGGSGTQIWFDPDLDSGEDFTNMYWRAERECVNGVWGEWSISRIKGEKGDAGDYVQLYYTWATEKPTKPSGTSKAPSGWHTNPEREDPTMTYGGTFIENNGYRYSEHIGDGEGTAEKVSFTTSLPNQIIAVDLNVSSESNYDWAYVGNLDTSAYATNYAARISGSTRRMVYLFVKNAGSHYFYVGYTKDSSSASGNDECWYRVIKTANLKCWVCQAQINGATDEVRSWSDVIQFIYDSASDESIYCLRTTNSTPNTPTSEPYIDDYVPSGWTDDPSNVSASYPYQFVSVRHKENGVWGSFSTPKIFSVYIKGDTGDFFEYRFAVNGSTSTPPSLTTTDRNPSGWSTVQPSLGSLQYMWMTVAKISGVDGSLLTNWSTPIRQTPYDGTNGKSPALVFRGVYNASKTYYGNENRVDCVKYGSTYYRARIDAPSGTAGFSGILPTNTDYWNAFGASFESVATDLLLAESASIGAWFHSGGKIVSTLSSGNKIELDASVPQIKVTSDESGGDYSEDTSLGAEISINGNTGTIRAQAKGSSSKVSYISPSGIFSNVAETQAVSSVTGYVRKGAIVGLGYGSLAKSTWELNKDEAMLAGVYGIAKNNTYNGAPAYGGYFYNLKACGMILNTEFVSDSSTSYMSISESSAQVFGLTNTGVRKEVYLPNDGYQGRIIIFHQMGSGGMRIYPKYGQHIYDDDSENDYYDVDTGDTLFAAFGIWYKNDIRTEIWKVGKFRF